MAVENKPNSTPKKPISQAEIERRLKHLDDRFNSYSKPLQGFISEFSSHMLEANEHRKYLTDPEKRQDLEQTLLNQGCPKEDIPIIWDYFNLPQDKLSA